MKDKIINIITAVALLLLILGIYFWSYKTQGPLTTATSCSGLYLEGKYNLIDLKKDCPNLSKDSLLNSTHEYFKNHSTSFNKTEAEVIADIENNF